jgi:hypothetical protein
MINFIGEFMAQTCSRVATIRQSLLNNFNGEASLQFPKPSERLSSPTFHILSISYNPDPTGRSMFLRKTNDSIYEMSNSERDKLSNLNLKRIEELSRNIDEYDGTYFEI